MESTTRQDSATAKLMEQWEGRMHYPISLTEIIPGGVTLNPGGVPIYENGECIGAIGVGGSSPQGDHEVARTSLPVLIAVDDRGLSGAVR